MKSLKEAMKLKKTLTLHNEEVLNLVAQSV
jgi:hypothetical protein